MLSVFNFSEIMAEKKATEQAAAHGKKEVPAKKDKATQKPVPAKQAEKAPKAPKSAKSADEVKAPAQPETPAATTEAPRPAKDEQIVYIKQSELHAFKNHPFQVRNDGEMKAMVFSVQDKGVTYPAIVRPREDGGYDRSCWATAARRQASLRASRICLVLSAT